MGGSVQRGTFLRLLKLIRGVYVDRCVGRRRTINSFVETTGSSAVEDFFSCIFAAFFRVNTWILS